MENGDYQTLITSYASLKEQDEDHQQEGMSPNTNQPTGSTRMMGSDQLPLMLLRCGHVFDTTCLEEWVSTGRSKINKCPICQHDVGAPPVQSTSCSGTISDSSNIVSTPTTNENIDTATSSSYNYQATEPLVVSPIAATDQSHSSSTDPESRETTRVYTQYIRERNFRLEQLWYWHPRYIRPHQISRWTQINYDQPLASDPSFLAKYPSLATANGNPLSGSSTSYRNRGGSSSWSFSSFGGGRSGGGRGSTW